MALGMAANKHIVIMASPTSGHGRDLIRGVSRFAKAIGDWHLLPVKADLDTVHNLKGWRPDGVIGLASPEIAAVFKKMKTRLINVSGVAADAPQVCTDSYAIGTLAAEALLERGFRTFAFYGTPNDLSRQRLAGFKETVNKHGFAVEVHLVPLNRSKTNWDWENIQQELTAWIRNLPKPVGVMSFNDERGSRLLQACSRCGVRVPQEVAVIGVDNDEIYCSITTPPLASVRCNFQKVGFTAARLMHEWIGGNTPPNVTLIPPVSVVVRESCDTIAIDDPSVAAALNFIRRSAHQPITVEDLLEEVATSRRTLERQFARILGTSPRAVIRRVQLDRAKVILRDTHLKVSIVAERSGFLDAKVFAAAFKKEVGQSPSEYRKSQRLV